MRFTLTGFIIGAIVALIFFVVATALLVFNHSALLFGLIAILLWLVITFNYRGRASIG